MKKIIAFLMATLMLCTYLPVIAEETQEPINLPDGMYGELYKETIYSGEKVSAELESGNLPSGLELRVYDETEVAVWGVPENNELCTFTIKISDNGNEFLSTYTIHISERGYTHIHEATVGIEYYEFLENIPMLSQFELIDGSIPQGLEITAEETAENTFDIVLYGTPEEACECIFEIKYYIDDTEPYYQLGLYYINVSNVYTTIGPAYINRRFGQLIYEEAIPADHTGFLDTVSIAVSPETELPAGLGIEYEIDEEYEGQYFFKCYLSGTPTEAGTYIFNIIITKDEEITELSFMLDVIGYNDDVVLLPTALVGEEYYCELFTLEMDVDYVYSTESDLIVTLEDKLDDEGNVVAHTFILIGVPSNSKTDAAMVNVIVTYYGTDEIVMHFTGKMYIVDEVEQITALTQTEITQELTINNMEDGTAYGLPEELSLEILPDANKIVLSAPAFSEPCSFAFTVAYTILWPSNADDAPSFLQKKVILYELNIVEPNCGDSNLDGSINTADAVTVLKHTAGLTQLNETQLQVSDTNHDSVINTADAVVILKYAAGLIETI